MRKRCLAVLLALLMCAALLAGCGESRVSDVREAQSLADLKGAKIAAQAGTFHADALTQIVDVQGSTYPEFADLLTALKSGAIDGYVAEEPTALSVCASDETLTYLPLVNNDTGFTATAADVGVAIGLVKGSPLLTQMNEILDGVSEEQKKNLMADIVSVCSGQELERVGLDFEEPTAPDGVLRVGMECAYEPYNWTDLDGTTPDSVPISGEGKEGLFANGYDVQIARYVAAKMNRTLEVYSLEWDSLLPALESGAIDAVIAGMSPTAERKAEIDFTQTYYESNLVVIVRNTQTNDFVGFLGDVGRIFTKYRTQLLRGVGNTMLIALTGTLAGLLIGLLTGIVRTAPMPRNAVLKILRKLLNALISIYVEIFRSTPMMVQAMVIYWGYAFASGGNTLPLLPSGILIVSINTGAYMAEIVRGGILSIDRGQFEGAMSIGMTHGQTMRRVILPQVLRNILPSVSNEFVINIKDTSVLNVIGVTELYYFAGIIKRQNFQTFQTYLVVCILYFIMTFTITRLLRLAEKKLAGSNSYTIFGSQSDSSAEIHIRKEGENRG